MPDINLNLGIILILLIITFGSIIWAFSSFLNPVHRERPPYPTMYYGPPSYPHYNPQEYYPLPSRSAPVATLFMIFIMILALVYVFSYSNYQPNSSELPSETQPNEGNALSFPRRNNDDYQLIPDSDFENTTDSSSDTLPKMQEYDDDVVELHPDWSRGFTVQAGSFMIEAHAKALANRLYDIFALPIVWYEMGGEYKVNIGIFESAVAADRFARELPAHGFEAGFKLNLSEMNIRVE